MPQVHDTIEAFRATLDDARRAGRSIGLVPTMGYLHRGHASLMVAAAAETDLAVATIFVNPLQFAADEDLSDYPRDLDRDLAIADDSGVSHVLVPSVEEMYPQPLATSVAVAGLTERFEGVSRPEHFGGVATVVTKLFAIAGPCRAYFGEKDYQQLAMVRRMAADLSLPVEVVGCPIIREEDGLALSSRNVYLSEAQRTAAPLISRALDRAVALAADGEDDPRVLESQVADAAAAEPEAELDYVALVDASSLEPVDHVGGPQRLLACVRFGSTRLLDNVAVGPEP